MKAFHSFLGFLIVLCVSLAASADDSAFCQSDLDCGPREVCEPSGASCDTPTCVEGCHGVAQCGAGQACVQPICVTCPCPGYCADLGPDPACHSDADCGDGEVCELGGPPDCSTPVCVAGCHEHRQCGEGRACAEVHCVTCPCPGECVDLGPDSECERDPDCADGEVCELGGTSCATPICVPGCREDAQCAGGEACAEVVCVTCPCPGQCVDLGPDPACRTDSDCDTGQVCELGGPGCDTPVCVGGCHDDSQCAEREACGEVVCVTCPCPGQCFDLGPDPDCSTDADCESGEVCELGGPGCTTPECVAGCHADEQCGENEVCQALVCLTCPCPGQCVDGGPDPACRTDADCRDGLVCELGGPYCTTPRCVEGCHRDAQCGEREICEEVVCVTCPCPGLCAPDLVCDPRRLPGDANGDFAVDGADYTIWADHFGLKNVGFDGGDFNCDGLVDGADYTEWADHFGESAEVHEAATEPACGLGAEVVLALLPILWLRGLRASPNHS